MEVSGGEVAEQMSRPTGVLVTTLTKRMYEVFTDYLEEKEVRVRLLNLEIHSIERIKTIQN